MTALRISGAGAHAPPGAGIAALSLVGDMLLSLGMLLTTASQLRIGDLPVGPGEACLVAWLILMPGRLGPSLTPALSRMLTFWVLFLFAESLGFLTGLFIGEEYDLRWLLHDAMAYPLLMAVGCLSVAGPDASDRLRRVAWLMTVFGAASLAFQLAIGWELLDVPIIQPWFWERFRGWSANPNQLALLCTVLGPLALHLADTAAGIRGRLVAICCMILALYVGRMTGSDTFTLAMLIAGPVFMAIKLRAWLLRPGRQLPIRSEFAGVIVLGLPLLLVSLLPAAVTAFADAESVTKDLAKNGGKELRQESDLRFALWTDAVQLGVATSFLGLGPGPHLEIPKSILAGRKTKDQPENLEHPKFSPVPNFEAHNSFLDLLTQGGVMALLSLVWILIVSGWLAYRARLAGLAALICALGVFCMTGLIIRHPIFWFAITLCLVAGDATDRVVTVRNVSPFQPGDAL